jgi:[ribosomal protein S5]-alanine N-acetyltransferase
MKNIIIETERLFIKYWTLDYLDELYHIMSDQRVHTYTGDSPWTLERCYEYIQYNINRTDVSIDNFHGAAIIKETNQLIGLTGLNPYQPKQPELEWQLGVPFWNKGYATEIGKAVIYSAFKGSDTTKIYGMVNPKNIGSIKAMEKIGMTCLGLQEFRGEIDMFFEIVR